MRATAGVQWIGRRVLGRVRIGLCLALALTACGGGGELSLTEYVERLNVIVEQARQDYEVLVAGPHCGVLIAEGTELNRYTPQDLQTAFERVREIESAVEAATAAIDPPSQVADLHRLFFDFDGGFIAAQEALAARAGTASGWAELSATAEMTAYRAALAADKQDCQNTQAEVNAISEGREVFAETPWTPGELKELFEVVLGCDGYPEHPEDLYRPPPTSTP